MDSGINRIVGHFYSKMACYNHLEIHRVYTRHLSSCFFVGCTPLPRSHRYLCSRGFIPLPPRCISKSIGYIFILTFPSWINVNNGHNLYVIYSQHAFYLEFINDDIMSVADVKRFSK
ncbi:hypothetical protein EIL81_17140 [Photorhabdus laumondii subsp. laumondii]|nr:hypothetical protein [Photorhabdus laumondii subsp. laumondii]